MTFAFSATVTAIFLPRSLVRLLGKRAIIAWKRLSFQPAWCPESGALKGSTLTTFRARDRGVRLTRRGCATPSATSATPSSDSPSNTATGPGCEPSAGTARPCRKRRLTSAVDLELRQMRDQHRHRQQPWSALGLVQRFERFERHRVGDRKPPLAVRRSAARCAPHPSASPMSSASART